jgi:hypothetical protein
MAGAWDPVLSRAAVQEVNRQYGLNRYLLMPSNALAVADGGQLTVESIDQLSQQDSDNDLYRYLRILLRLREVAAATQPVQADSDLARLLRQRRKEREARLHLTRWQEMVREGAVSAGLPMRASAVLAFNEMSKTRNRPALHELASRLTAQGDRWREAGRLDDAVLAHRAIVELTSDLVNDSPTPDVAWLAAQHLPSALSALGEDLRMLAEAGQDDGLKVWAGACEDQAARVADFADDWSAASADGRTNLLPHMAEGMLVRAAHDRALGSMCALVVAGFVWLVGFVMTIELLVAAAIFGKRQPNDCPSERHVWLAVVALAAMLVAVLWWLMWADVRFDWLFSLPTLPLSGVVPAWLPVWLPGIVFLIAIVPVVFWIVVERSLAARSAMLSASRWTLISGVSVLLTLVVILLFWPMDREGWQPPVNIQKLRASWLVVGVEAVLIAVGGMTVLMWRGQAGLDRWGSRCRLLSFVAARTLLVISLIVLACLVVNLRNDRLHSRAFFEASRDPVADRLQEKDWNVAYFGGVTTILEGLDQRE